MTGNGLASITTSKEELINRIKGQTVVLEDVKALLPEDWYSERNPHYLAVKETIDQWSATWMTKEELRKSVKGDFIGLACYFYPFAGEDELVWVTKFMTWIFLWDDEFDDGPLRDDLEGAQHLREETLNLVAALVGRETGNAEFHVNSTFTSVMKALRDGGHVDVARRVHDDLVEFVDEVTQLQHNRFGGLPTLQEFWTGRLISVGLQPNIELIDFCSGYTLPQDVLDNEDIRIMRDMSTEITTLGNEIFSFRKELAQDQIDNLIPLLIYEKNLDAQEAIDEACRMVSDAVSKFNAAEENLDEKILAVPGAVDFIKGFRH